ncbi:MAG: hypothetical protein CSA38_02405 [Flavobacteriales bacterium]|nr:MAG: hypothetical protein CSA38_02405 [Flavobacteriales bacterium]
MFNQPFFPYVFALILATPFLMLLKQFVHEYIKMKNQELKMLTMKGNTENKSQAYERMALFLERIKPSNLVKNFDADLAIHEFVYLTEKTITEEFEYNVSQQLYIPKETWSYIVECKESIIKILKHNYEEINSDTITLEEFKTIFLMSYVENNDFISETIEVLKKELLLVT